MEDHHYGDASASFHDSFHMIDDGDAMHESAFFASRTDSIGSIARDDDTDTPSADAAAAAAAAGNNGNVPDSMLLNLYCAKAKPPKDQSEEALEIAEKSWQPVRQWLGSHSAEEVRAAAECKGESGLTALHFACRHVPPMDVIDVFLSIAADTVRWPDSFGWLPIHYACASGSSSEVIKALAESLPESKTAVDRRGRTPLHFALGDRPASPQVIFLLSASGAAGYADEIGMLPLHYACAFGASEQVLYVLTEAYPQAITAKDKRQRTPLHFALSNAGRKTVPSAVRLLLSLNREIVNAIDNGPLPLRVLAEYAHTIKPGDDLKEEKQESAFRCLDYLLHAEPDPTADFLTALQSLPDWLSERAVVMPVVQILLNEKISQRFPTAVMMLDFYILAMIIISYSFNVVNAIERRSDPNLSDAVPGSQLAPLFVGTVYFLLREVIQVVSLLSLKSFNIWLYDLNSYLNVAFFFLVLFWTSRMSSGVGDALQFRIGTAVSAVLIWLKLLAFVRRMLIDFAVFVDGVFYVVRRLAAFLTALGVILIAFAQMFFTVFQQTDYCRNQPNDFMTQQEILEATKCDASELRPYCSFWDSFLSVYTMLLGEVDETDFLDAGVATVLFIIFMFLCVILLANVLIAIVTDSYKVVQEQRAAIVFWTNRLDFVAEMDGIANGPWRNRLRQYLGCGKKKKTKEVGDSSDDHDDDPSHSNSMVSATPSRAKQASMLQRRMVRPLTTKTKNFHAKVLGRLNENVFGYELWKTLMDLFEDEVDDSVFSLEFFAYTLLRMVVALIVIPLWFILGMVTVGWLWPPQVRENVFTSTVFKHSSDAQKENELRKRQIQLLQEEIKDWEQELLQELAMDRTQVVQLKSHIASQKMEIAAEMRQLKQIVSVLFERQVRFQQ